VLETLAGRVPGGDALRAALTIGDVDGALELLRSNGSIDLAVESVTSWAARAKDSLSSIPASPGREALEQLADFLIGRSR
jgi:heptaprenyl diphosphate synthase